MLTVIGVIALLVFAKFLFDTYVTGSNQKNFEEYKNREPEEAARIQRNKGLNLNVDYKFNQTDINFSLALIAENLNCSREEVKVKFIESLGLEIIENKELLKKMIDQFRQRKFDESLNLEMDPDNTPSAFYHKWALEYQDKLNEKNGALNEYRVRLEELFKKVIEAEAQTENYLFKGTELEWIHFERVIDDTIEHLKQMRPKESNTFTDDEFSLILMRARANFFLKNNPFLAK